MRFGKPRRQFLAGAAEKLGVAAIIGSTADFVAAQLLPWPADFFGFFVGLFLILVGVIVLPDE